MHSEIQKLHQFWFGQQRGELAEPGKNKLWYFADASTDQRITYDYQDLLLQAARGELRNWQQTPQGYLMLIILLDQLSRNIYRGTAQAFAYDPVALKLCEQGLELGVDRSLCLVEKLFFYHPLEHAENIHKQDKCVQLIHELSHQYQGEAKAYALRSLEFAREHRKIIHQFGRFPHRNEVLGRVSTQAELDYLAAGGKRFGQ